MKTLFSEKADRVHALLPILGVALMAAAFPARTVGNSDTSTETSRQQVVFTSSNLPIVVIDTQGQRVPDEPKITADMGIIYNGPGVRNNITDSFNHYNGKIGIEIRGSSSQMFPKKQYAMETRDTQGNDLKVSLLGFPEESDWVLYAPYTDKTLMRNVLAYKLMNDLGRYASRTHFCEVVLNGEYCGVYVLMEKIKRDKNRVNITKLEPNDISGDAVTGGYIIKIDKREGANTQGWYSQFLPYPGAWQKIYYQYDYPKQDEIVPQQKTYIQNYIYNFENLMASPDYADPQRGYAQYLDVASCIDVFILNEISRNVDGYRLSAFMHKDRDSKNGKLVMGPIWDYDLAFGNANYYDAEKIAGWQIDFRHGSDSFAIPFWWPKLAQDSSFVKRLKSRWRELRQSVLDVPRIHAYIDSMAQYLDEAQKRNFEKWPVLGTYVWPNPYIGNSYLDELNYLKTWVNLRILWMDASLMEQPSRIADHHGQTPGSCRLEQNYPNPYGRLPFNPTTTIAFHLPHAGRVSLKIIDISGNEVATLVQREMNAGKHEIVFDATAMASGVYFYRLEAGNFTAQKKLLVVR
ncbi:MAG: CotH kinase family protein [candidate division KSB1 bacterium]|nr:CotH kinase family protein [candidate division KSB1 bacterium]MDZ7301875.1 CotH kinase family protein [candidate division KSB1 bacterium]MDZ7310258.1 CotH kinase family protein [candidate division KSB1 bacterium]